jgi:hypothetical protein
MKLRRMRVAVFWLAFLVCIAPSAGASQQWAGLGSNSNSNVKVEVASVAPVKVRQGGNSTVTLNFRVRPNYHINSNTPGSGLLIPTVLRLDPPTDVIVGSTTYPEGKNMAFSFAPGHELNVYTGDFEVTTRVMVERKLRPGKYRVRGNLRYQACDARACYSPTELPVTFDVQVVRPSSGHKRRNPAQSPHAR